MTPEEVQKNLSRLTDREYQILQLYCDGLTHARIAEIIHRSRENVSSHMLKIRAKLQLTANDEDFLITEYCPFTKGKKPPASIFRRKIKSVAEPEVAPNHVPNVEQKISSDSVSADEKKESSPETEIPIPVEPKGKGVYPTEKDRTKTLRDILIGVAIGAFLVCVLFTIGALALRNVIWPNNQGEIPTAEVTREEVTREVTVVVTNTPEPPGPTPTAREVVVTKEVIVTKEVEKEVTVVVTATPTPGPSSTPTPTQTPTSTPLPEPMSLGDSAEVNGLRLTLDDIRLNTDKNCIVLLFDFKNNAEITVVTRLGTQSITVVDNLGRKWTFNGYGDCSLGCTNTSKRDFISSVKPDDNMPRCGGTWKAFFGAYLTDPNVDEIIITATILDIQDAKWVVPIIN